MQYKRRIAKDSYRYKSSDPEKLLELELKYMEHKLDYSVVELIKNNPLYTVISKPKVSLEDRGSEYVLSGEYEYSSIDEVGYFIYDVETPYDTIRAELEEQYISKEVFHSLQKKYLEKEKLLDETKTQVWVEQQALRIEQEDKTKLIEAHESEVKDLNQQIKYLRMVMYIAFIIIIALSVITLSLL